ncbi:MAG: hypothetical protein FWH35_03030 [Treponema sp.]|nr:hypothetical protein [Treponema sp.]
MMQKRFSPLMILLLISILNFSCSNKKKNEIVEKSEGSSQSGPAWQALAQLNSGENPIWFELGTNGPSLIDSPASASLVDFSPWPFARYITGMKLWDSFLVIAVNRNGFIILGVRADAASAYLYHSTLGESWKNYTAESFFSFNGKPAILLYRNDFFSESDLALPKPQVFVLDNSSPAPLAVSVPAFENFPSGWEVEVIHRGSDGLWYFRAKDKNTNEGEIAYYKTGNLSSPGQKISMGQWWSSGSPESFEKIPHPLTAIINTAISSKPEEISLIKVISSDLNEPRFFAPFASENAGLELYVFYREMDNLALAIFSNGSGFISREKEAAPRALSLPSLPPNFVYTGIAVIGKILVVSWEEQEDAGIGAAGFLVLSVDKL